VNFYFLYNPQRKDLLGTVSKFEQVFSQAQHIHHFQQLAGLTEGVLICFGGDGTFHQAVNKASHHLKFILVPCGSGNDFVRNFEAIKLDKVMDALEQDSFYSVGLIKINELYGLNAAGLLFDAHVATQVNKTTHKNALSYAWQALRNIFSYKPQRLLVNEVPQNLLLISFGNGAYAGGGFNLFPGTHPKVFSFMRLQIGPLSYLKRLIYLILVRPGLHGKLSGVHLSECTHTSVSSMHNIPAEIDGEIYDLGNHVKIGYLPSAINIMVAN
jgi:diacylglycerol kinase (ATP)